MSEFQNVYQQAKADGYRDFLGKVFFTMSLGLFVSFGVAFLLSMNNGYYLYLKYSLAIIILQFALAFVFTFFLRKMSTTLAWICFVGYSALMGVTFSILPLIYEGGSIVFALAATLILFLSLTIIAQTTKIDLTAYGTYLIIGLVAIIITSLINVLFIHSSLVDMLVTYAGIGIFLFLTVYDMQKLKKLYYSIEDSTLLEKYSIYGAFELYLDFINLFIRILQIFGKRRN